VNSAKTTTMIMLNTINIIGVGNSQFHPNIGARKLVIDVGKVLGNTANVGSTLTIPESKYATTFKKKSMIILQIY